MSDGATKDAGALFGDALALVRANGQLVVAAWTVMTAIAVASDLLGQSGLALNFAGFIASLVLQYEVTLTALSQLGLAVRRSKRRLWALFGLSILYGLGVLVGLILLILPGLYLYVRWSVAVPVLIAEDAGVGDAFARSGEEISGRFWPVAGTLLLIYLPWVAAFVAAAIFSEPSHFLSSLTFNGLLNMGVIGGWCAAVAIYADGKGDNRLAEVFA